MLAKPGVCFANTSYLINSFRNVLFTSI